MTGERDTSKWQCIEWSDVKYVNYILNESEARLLNTIFVEYCDAVDNVASEYTFIDYFQTHHQLSKFAIRDLAFKPRFTSLLGALGLIDGVHLNIITATDDKKWADHSIQWV